MLKKLLIKNIALIESVEIDFVSGLNVLSGETGAGKSVIIDSLNFVLGAKAEKSMIRSGENDCFVKAEFEVENVEDFKEIFDEFDLELDDSILISRKFSIDGKSSIKINGSTVTAHMLRKITSKLVDVHGQSEHFYLLNPGNQLALIDRFGGEDVAKIKTVIKSNYEQYKSVIKSLDQMGGDESQRLMRLDVINYQINEITAANYQKDEEIDLVAIKDKLRNQERIISALTAVKSAINDEGGVSDVLGNATRVFSPISDLASEYSSLFERLNSVYSEIDDISSEAASLIDEFEYSEYDPNEIEERLSLIKSLKRKYGNNFEEIEEYLTNVQEEKARLENYNEVAAELLDKKIKLEKTLYDNYSLLSDLRRKAAKQFSISVISELRELKMDKACFDVEFNDKPNLDDCKFDSPNGFDGIEFMFSANLGQPLKTMSKVISGGEISRFMLSIKAQTAKYNEIGTFIFDEIDAGISGVVAKVVAEKFAKISKSTQIIAISHLPQISAMADNNILIVKFDRENSTVTEIKMLNAEQKICEITRLVGGDSNSASAKAHAEELIDQAKQYKNSL